MGDGAQALKSLSKETKALVIVSEFEARRMPVFQLRAVLHSLINDDEERKVIIDMIERDLRATGYPADQIGNFLTDLMAVEGSAKQLESNHEVQSTRRLRSPFSHGFEATSAGMSPATMSPDTFHPSVSLQPPPDAIPAPSSPTRISISRLTNVINAGATSTSIPNVVTGPANSSASASLVGTAGGSSRKPSVLPGNTSVNPPSHRTSATSAPVASPSPTVPPSLVPLVPSTSPLAVPSARGTPASGTVMRRNTFAFVPSKPSENAPTVNPPVAAVPSGAGGSEGGPAPAGTMAWRLQQAFGNSKMMPAAAGTQRPIILVADDDKRIRMVFRLRLEEAGMTVVEYDNGLSAWERLQKNDVAAAVLDMKMPGLHGLEVLSHMIDHNLSTPVVVCSAYDQLQDEFVVRTYPHLRYLVKPVAPDQLVSAIRELLTPKAQ